MFLIDPGSSPYDLRFSLGRIPVRVNPWFWGITILMGNPWRAEPIQMICWVGVVFVSILVHELGHALAALSRGWRPEIVLYQFGGLAMYRPTRREPYTQIGISFAGPAAGFLLATLLMLCLWIGGWQPGFIWTGLGQELVGPPGTSVIFESGPVVFTIAQPIENRALLYVVFYALQVNIWWGLVNLLPVYPLDGGQIAGELLTLSDPRQGQKQALQLSIFTAVAVAAVFLVQFLRAGDRSGLDLYVPFMFGALAYQNWQMLEQLDRGSSWREW